MSIDTELARLTNAKAAIKAAIEGKGVTVPDGTLLDGMASLIEGIEAGGGGINVAQGTFIPEENTISFTAIHNLGKMPRIYCVMLATNTSRGISKETNPTYRFLLGCDFWSNGALFKFDYISSFQAERVSYYKFVNIYVKAINENSITFGSTGINTSYTIFKANTEYMWFVAG